MKKGGNRTQNFYRLFLISPTAKEPGRLSRRIPFKPACSAQVPPINATNHLKPQSHRNAHFHHNIGYPIGDSCIF